MPATINGTSGFGGNLTGNVTGNADTSNTATTAITAANATNAITAVTASKLTTTTGNAPVYACRAWVNFDGKRDSSGATTTANTARFIRASGNVSSVTKTGTGTFEIIFSTAMPDANYVVVGSCDRDISTTGATLSVEDSTVVSTGVTVRTVRHSTSGSAQTDATNNHVAIFA
jgi:hypothetical protein